MQFYLSDQFVFDRSFFRKGILHAYFRFHVSELNENLNIFLLIGMYENTQISTFFPWFTCKPNVRDGITVKSDG